MAFTFLPAFTGGGGSVKGASFGRGGPDQRTYVFGRLIHLSGGRGGTPPATRAGQPAPAQPRPNGVVRATGES